MDKDVYFFDDSQKLIKIVGEDKLFSVVQEKEITPSKDELINDKLAVSMEFDDEIKESAYMAVRESESSFSMYKIIGIADPGSLLIFTGINFGPDELDAYIINDIRPANEYFQKTIQRVMDYTLGEWRVGHLDSTLPTVSMTFYYCSIREALKSLQTLGCEILFRCNLTGEGIADKWIEVYRQIGEYSNERYEYGDKALTIEKEVDRSNIYTSLIGRGRGEEVGDGYGRRIEFDQVYWSKSKGDPLNKPTGQINLEIPEMTEKYGIPTKNGKRRKREKVIIFEDCEDPVELIQLTYQELVNCSRPLVQFKATIFGADSLGNIIRIHRDDRGYHYETRIFSVKIDRLTGKVETGLGDNLNTSSTRQASNTQTAIQTLDEKKMTFYESTEVSKWQSDIIRGAKGGSIIMMNPWDTGKGESRQPYQMVWMNGDSIETSNHFLVANSEGIGFIDGKFNEANFKTAWTIDGNFNANYIQSGRIRADIFETSFNAVGDQLKLVKGALQVVNSNKKIMELTKKGMEFWNSKESIGTIGTTDSVGNPFPEASTPVPLENNSLVIKANGTANAPKYILLSSKEGKGIVLAGDYGFHQGDFSIYGKALVGGSFSVATDATIAGRLDVKELYVNGVKIDTNGGNNTGGNDNGWNGQYPPEVTSDRDKRYWQIWAMALGAGFSKQAAAALLGNAQGESDANPTADEGNGAPGFGYGVWQWTDSTGANSGRVYMINLMTKAGISDNPDTIAAQFKLLMWHAPNGQWIATSTYPYSWTQFMTLTDINTAAQAFVANFERPRDPHPERTTWAQEWYDKFKDLEIPASKGYIKPIVDPITVTSEFGWRTSPITGAQEFHNGIDLVNGNPNTPIFASADGEVIVAGDANYFDWYGNWTVIKHADGMYTGYAHQSRVDVSKGQKVTAGQQIGLMGTTGPSTGEHLHFQFMDEFYPSSAAHFHNARDYINF